VAAVSEIVVILNFRPRTAPASPSCRIHQPRHRAAGDGETFALELLPTTLRTP
jgi:hypothetical protein